MLSLAAYALSSSSSSTAIDGGDMSDASTISSGGTSSTNSRKQKQEKSRLRKCLSPRTLLFVGLFALYHSDPDGAGLRRINTVSRALWGIFPFAASSSTDDNDPSTGAYTGDCTLRTPDLSLGPTTPTFCATFPGTDTGNVVSKLTQYLSGLAAAEEYSDPIDPRRFTVVTHYPHVSGKKLDNDYDYHHGIVAIRNPMTALPNYHQHIFEHWNDEALNAAGKATKEDRRAPREDWEAWRDEHFSRQMDEWKNFVAFWLDRIYPDKRLLFSYEELIDKRKGPEIAKRINSYTKNKIEVGGEFALPEGEVACTWNKVINAGSVAAQHAVAAESDDRPYTAEQMDLALRIMLELRDKYSDEKELADILDMYIDRIENDDGGNSRSVGSISMTSPPPVVTKATVVEATSQSTVKEQPPQLPPMQASQVVLMPSNLNPGIANEFLNPAPIEIEDHNNMEHMHHHAGAATDDSSGSAIYAPPSQER
mmetsp:Transcript_28101/g.81233  ORF Transcript_28101/g.81233 Transcript_28101/m.81233 type:complete len:480 (-) Transcript_28101:558-1997(-)